MTARNSQVLSKLHSEVIHSETKELKESWTNGESWTRKERQEESTLGAEKDFDEGGGWSERKDFRSILLSEQGGGWGNTGREHS